MKHLKFFVFILSFIGFVGSCFASTGVFNDHTAKKSLQILKRIEYKEGLPNGMLHAISLVETNIGQTGKYRPWPYTIRLNRYKKKELVNVDDVYENLDLLIDMGYQNFDLIIDGERFYGLSAIGAEEVLNSNPDAKLYKISARSLIKYFKNKQAAVLFLDQLIKNKNYNFKIGIMQLDYKDAKSELKEIEDALNVYQNAKIMVKKLKKIRTKHSWWESVGFYHSKKPSKAKRYVKNVWSMYQRVYKVKVR